MTYWKRVMQEDVLKHQLERLSTFPHHAVHHPRKPGKIRVVFDCSAEFEGKSINKELLPGPDLTNQIVNGIKDC